MAKKGQMLVVGNADDIARQPHGDELEWVSGEEFVRRHKARMAALPMNQPNDSERGYRTLPHIHQWRDGGYCQGVPQLDCMLCGISVNDDSRSSAFMTAMADLGDIIKR